ncbi:MAG: tetratricopeptide repeat protein [bacterium]|nr:tetratricopeptide repeat protein [bacterium]
MPIAKRLGLFGLLAVGLFLVGCQGGGAKNMYDMAIRQWEEGKYDESVQNLIALTKAYPEDDLVDDSIFWIANIYEHYLKNPTQAIRYYRSLTKSFESSEYYHPGMRGLARTYSAQDKEGKRKAILIYNKLQERKLPLKENEEIQWELAQLYFDFAQYEQSRVELKKLITSSPESSLSPKAYHLIGYSYYLEGKSDLAELTYKETDRKYNFTRSSLDSALSLADIYEDQDRLSEAIRVYNTILARLEPKEIFHQLASNRVNQLRTRLKQTNKG